MNGLKKVGTFSYPPSSQLFESAECFNFRFFPFHKKLFCIIFGLLNIGRCFVVISDRWTILEIAKYSKTKTFPLFVRFLICHCFRRFSIFTVWLGKFTSCSNFYYGNCTTIIFKVCFIFLFVCLIKTFHATECHIYSFQFTNTGYFAFCKLGISSKTTENLRKIFKVSNTEF